MKIKKIRAIRFFAAFALEFRKEANLYLSSKEIHTNYTQFHQHKLMLKSGNLVY